MLLSDVCLSRTSGLKVLKLPLNTNQPTNLFPLYECRPMFHKRIPYFWRKLFRW